MIQTIVGIIRLAHFFGALRLWQLEFVALMKQLEREDVLVFEGVLLVGMHVS